MKMRKRPGILLAALFVIMAVILAGREMAGQEMAGREIAGREMAGQEMAGQEIAGQGTEGRGQDAPGNPMLLENVERVGKGNKRGDFSAPEYRPVLPEADCFVESEARGCAVLEDGDFIYFYSGCEIRKISREGREVSVIWRSGETEAVSLRGRAILIGEKIFFLESWWARGTVTEILSVVNTDGTGYERIEEEGRFADYFYLTDVLKTGNAAYSNRSYVLCAEEDGLYLTDRVTQESRLLGEDVGNVIGMDEKYAYLCREDSTGEGKYSLVYEKLALEDGEKSTLFVQEGFSDISFIRNITGSCGLGQVAGGCLYYVEESGGKLYLARRSLEAPWNREVLGDALFDSGVGEVGRVEKYSEEARSEVNPDWGYVAVNLERLVVDESFPGGVEINRFLAGVQEEIIAYEKENFQYMEEYLGEFGESLARGAEREGYHFCVRYSYTSVLSPVACYGGRYISFYQDNDDDTGGAHGFLSRDGYTFDLLTGERMELGDVVENSEEEIKEIVTEYYAFDINEHPEAFWEDAEDIVRDSIGMGTGFYLTEEGICFFLPPYAIASFAGGFQEVTVPYEEFDMRIGQRGQEDRNGELFFTGSGKPADAGAEARFPPEMVSMLEDAFMEGGWRGLSKMLSAGSAQPGEGSAQPGEGSARPGEGSAQPGEGGVRPEQGSGRSGSGSARPETADSTLPEWACVDWLGDSEVPGHFPLVSGYTDQMTYDYELYDAVSCLYHGPEEICFIYYLPQRERGKYALVYESGKSGGKSAYSVLLADIAGDALVPAAEFDVQDNIGKMFLYEGEYYFVYGWKSGGTEDGCDGFMLHRLSVNPGKETLLGRKTAEGEFVLTEGEVFTAEKTEDLFTPSERRVGQFGYIVYENRWDFEEERNLPFADDGTAARLREIYTGMEMEAEFQECDSETNAVYLDAFRKLMENEAEFHDPETGQEYFLKDYEGIQLDIEEEGVYAPGRFEYYFFDADGDGYPELGILEQYPEGHSAFLYLFQYNLSTGKYSLWNTLYPPCDLLLGTGKVLEYDGYHMKMDYGYYQLDAKGDVEYKAYLYYLPISMFEQLCLVMLPAYTDSSRNVDVTRGMERCGIYAREPGEWYFRVTEEQFWELEEVFREAMESAERREKEVLYTYEEFFSR